MSRSPLVLLLRDPASPDPYGAALQARGYDVAFAPVLHFETVQEDPLAERLAAADSYTGLILTSPRAARALALHPHLLPRWRRRSVYVVGPATADAVRGLGLTPAGEESGTAEQLAETIVREAPAGRLLFLSGERRRDVLPQALSAAGRQMEELVVYRTELVPPRLPRDTPRWAAFFSPSGVEAARLATGMPWNSLRTAAIGPTTAEALRAAGHPASATADRPQPDALAEAIATADLPQHL